MVYRSIARKAMKLLVSQNLIARVGEYNSQNPIYKGLQLKQASEETEAKGKKGKKGKKAGE